MWYILSRYVTYIVQICDIYRPDMWHISSRYMTYIVQICNIYRPTCDRYRPDMWQYPFGLGPPPSESTNYNPCFTSYFCAMFFAPHLVTTYHFTVYFSPVCDVIVLSIPFMSRVIMTTVQIGDPNVIVQICKLHCIPKDTVRCNTHNHRIVCAKSRVYLRFAYVCCPDVIHLLDICIYWWCVLHIWTMRIVYLDECYIFELWVLHMWTTLTYLDNGGYIFGRLLRIRTIGVTYPDDCYISGRWVLHIWTSVTYLDDGGYISVRVLHIWTMGVTYLDECYISGRWVLHIWTSVTYLDDGGYISVRVLHIWTMEVTYMDDCYISGRWGLHIWTSVTYLDNGVYISGRLWTATTRHVTRPALFIIDLSHHVPHAWLAIIRAIRTAPVPAKSCRRKWLVSLTLIPHQYRSQHKIACIVNTETIVAKVQPLVYNYFYSVIVKICITFHIAIIQIQKSHSH